MTKDHAYLYLSSISEAKRQNEVALWRASHLENIACTQSYSLECDGDVIIVVRSMMEIRCVDNIFLNICGKSFIKAGEICPKSLVKIFFDVTLQLFR